MNNTTNKKKLELKKTAIANLTLSESQMKMVVGGGDADFNLSRIPTKMNNTDDGNGCTANEPQKNNTN